MPPIHAVRHCIANAFRYSGRAPRAEFWWFAAFNLLVALVALALDGPLPTPGNPPAGPRWAGFLSSLLLFAPNLAVAVRRLHDIGQTGRWLWLIPTPTLIAILYALTTLAFGLEERLGNAAIAIAALVTPLLTLALFVAAALRGTRGPNAYGPDPLARGDFGVPSAFRFRP